MAKKAHLRALASGVAGFPQKRGKAPQIANGGPSRAYLRGIHQLCRRCRLPCKQYDMVKMIKCPQFLDKRTHKE